MIKQFFLRLRMRLTASRIDEIETHIACLRDELNKNLHLGKRLRGELYAIERPAIISVRAK